MSMARALALLALAALALPACTVDRDKHPQYDRGDCPPEQRLDGYCIEEGNFLRDGDDGGPPPGDGDGSSQACGESGDMDFCYEGDAGTATTGRCRAGNRICLDGSWGACLGQVLPSEEVCNGDDDDCDGAIDEGVVLGSCSTGQVGACDTGVLSCEGGIAFCVSESGASAEVCDGDDNDCDGDTDEETDGPCYPGAMAGCTELPMGGFDCDGICAAGMQRCVDGVLEACEGFVPPMTEQCNTGSTAADEDCNGETDETCTCTGNQEQDCYSGPEGTEGRGICKAGRQLCDGGFFGECVGQTMPGVESCSNLGADDDCDGEEDNIPGRGVLCEPSADAGGQGRCADGTWQCDGNRAELRCVPFGPIEEICGNGIDEDCDGSTDEDFKDDPEMCGSSCERCDEGQDCCNGECITIRSNDSHCGGCGRECGSGLKCCGSECVDLETNPLHCGECNNDCPPVGLTGERCCIDARCLEDEISSSDECSSITLPPLPGGDF